MTTLFLVWLYNLLYQPHDSKQFVFAFRSELQWHYFLTFLTALTNRVKKTVFRWAKKLPFVSGKVNDEINKTANSLEETFHSSAKNQEYLQILPKKGLDEVRFMSSQKRRSTSNPKPATCLKYMCTVYNLFEDV